MGNWQAHYNDFIVYDIRSAWNREPGHLNHCPFCNNAISPVKLQPSDVVKADMDCHTLIPIYHGTHAFSCSHCGWWAIREQWSLYECVFGSYDYLITGVLQRWNIAALLEPLAMATECLQQNRAQPASLCQDIAEQTQAIANVMDPYWPKSKVCHLGNGADEKGHYGLFLIDNAAISFLVILKQSQSGWLNLEVVESINGYFPAMHSQPAIEISSARLINRQQPKSKIKRRISNVEIKTESLQLLFPSALSSAFSWEQLSKLPNLYDDRHPLPDSLTTAFLPLTVICASHQ